MGRRGGKEEGGGLPKNAKGSYMCFCCKPREKTVSEVKGEGEGKANCKI